MLEESGVCVTALREGGEHRAHSYSSCRYLPGFTFCLRKFRKLKEEPVAALPYS